MTSRSRSTSRPGSRTSSRVNVTTVAHGQQRGQELTDRRVEADRRRLGQPVARPVAERVERPVEVVLHRPVGDRHALGTAGRAGGEDDVGDAVAGRGARASVEAS